MSDSSCSSHERGEMKIIYYLGIKQKNIKRIKNKKNTLSKLEDEIFIVKRSAECNSEKRRFKLQRYYGIGYSFLLSQRLLMGFSLKTWLD